MLIIYKLDYSVVSESIKRIEEYRKALFTKEYLGRDKEIIEVKTKIEVDED